MNNNNTTEMMSRKYGKITYLADVYSFAMIALELVSLKLPFDNWEESQIPLDVVNGDRPDIPSDCNPFFKELIIQCWQGESTKRPSFPLILEKLKSQKPQSNFPNLQPLSKKLNNVVGDNTKVLTC